MFKLWAVILVVGSFVLKTQTCPGVTLFSYDTAGNQLSQQTANAAAPVILGSSPNQVVATGGIGGFSVNVSSPQTVTYQWYFNGTAIAGATGDSLLLTNVTTTNEGSYTVRVTNGSGSVTSSAYKLGVDLNGNGLPDSWELAYFGNLNQTTGDDYDGDGISNLDEFLNGTNPAVRETYYWNVASGDFTIPTNWVRYNTPGVAPRAPGPGDTAVINTGTFTLPANTTIPVSQVTVNAPFTAPTDSDYTLNVTGQWTFTGPFTLANGRQFSVSGSGGSVSVVGTTNLTGAYLLVDNGATLSFPNVSSYAVPAGLRVQWLAQHTGSTLALPNLTTISGPTTPGTYLDLQSAGYNGTSTLSLPALTTITKAADGDAYANSGVRLSADYGGIISAPNLSSFQDNDSAPNSSLEASGGGVMLLPNLTLGGIRGVTLIGVTLTAAPVSAPIIKSVVLANGTIKLTVPTLTGRTYQLQQTNALTSTTSWQNVGSAQTGTNAPMDFTTSATGTKGFYRVMVTSSQ